MVRNASAIASLNVTRISAFGETLFALFGGSMATMRGGVPSRRKRPASTVPCEPSAIETFFTMPTVSSSER